MFLGKQHAGNATDDILCIFENTRVGKTRDVRVNAYATQIPVTCPMYKKPTTKQNATDAFDGENDLSTNSLSVQLEVGINQHLPWKRNCRFCVLSRLGDVPASQGREPCNKRLTKSKMSTSANQNKYRKPADSMKKITCEHRERGRPCKSISYV